MTLLASEFVLMVAGVVYACCRIAPDNGSIPMQWSLSGNVNWSAPRLLAFAFVPILAFGGATARIERDLRAVST